MNDTRLRLVRKPLKERIYGYIRRQGEDVLIIVNANPALPDWRKHLALMHELLHLVEFIQKKPRVHIALHYAALLALIYERFGMADFESDFNLIFKLRSPFNNREIKWAIRLYRELRRKEVIHGIPKGI